MSVKKTIKNVLDSLPEDVSWDEVQYRLYVCESIEKGLEEMGESEGISREDAEKMMESWFK